MLKTVLRVSCIAGVSLLAACGGAGTSGSPSLVLTTPTPPPSTPPATPPATPAPVPTPVDPLEPKTLTDILLLDAARMPLSDADVLVEDEAEAAAPKAAQMVKTDSKGIAKVNLKPQSNYLMTISKKTGSVGVKVKMAEKNASEVGTLITPLSCGSADSTACTDVSEEAIVGSIAGTVLCDGEPAPDSQVAVSGGAATNGRFATATTNEKGEYTLLYNVNRDLAPALEKSTFSASSEACEEMVIQDFAVTGENLYGQNFELVKPVPGTTPPVAANLFRETFEVDSPTAADWVVEGGFSPSDTNLMPTTWQLLSAGHALVSSLVPTYSTLPADDTSAAAVPEPIQGARNYWYGGRSTGTFIGEQDDSPEETLTGGTSTIENEGTLTSPSIDFSAVAEGTDVSLTFKSWWEIEAVNPNSSGFDLMTIEISTDGGASFKPIARLNPLSDPDTGDTDRSPLAYTTAGFNAAAVWVQQERIPLEGVQGQANVKLRFTFETVDAIYNGFRGWLIDDVVVAPVAGTFPLMELDDEAAPEPTEPTTTSKTSAKRSQWQKPARD